MARQWTEEEQAKASRSHQVRRKVDSYLKALEQLQEFSQRRDRLSPDQLQVKIDAATAEVPSLSGVKRLLKIQEVQDLKGRLEAATAPGPQIDLKTLEDEFVDVAAEFSAKNNISYAAWREIGVSGDVLRSAGLMRVQKLEPAE